MPPRKAGFMDLQDRIIELLLAAFDRLINLLTFGAWSRWQGSREVNCQVKDQ